jgi:hypothetical protein
LVQPPLVPLVAAFLGATAAAAATTWTAAAAATTWTTATATWTAAAWTAAAWTAAAWTAAAWTTATWAATATAVARLLATRRPLLIAFLPLGLPGVPAFLIRLDPSVKLGLPFLGRYREIGCHLGTFAGFPEPPHLRADLFAIFPRHVSHFLVDRAGTR